jgi:cytoskeletal protein RodZ
MDDAEFEAYIGRRSRLSRHYRDLQAELPPKELDDAVLLRARSAHNLKRAELPEREVYVGWMAPVAFAATVVLVFTVVLQIVIRPQLHARLESDAERQAAVQPSVEPNPARQSIAVADNVPAAKFEAPATVERRIVGAVTSEAPAPATLDRAKAAASQPASATRVEEPVLAAQSPAETQPDAKESEVAVPAPAARASGTLSMIQSSHHAAAVDADKLQRDPKAWLAAIERLRASGKVAAADQQMKLFLAKYPDYLRTHPLPDDAR